MSSMLGAYLREGVVARVEHLEGGYRFKLYCLNGDRPIKVELLFHSTPVSPSMSRIAFRWCEVNNESELQVSIAKNSPVNRVEEAHLFRELDGSYLPSFCSARAIRLCDQVIGYLEAWMLAGHVSEVERDDYRTLVDRLGRLASDLQEQLRVVVLSVP